MSVRTLRFPTASYIGTGAVRLLDSVAASFSPSCILLISDPVLVRLGLIDRIAAPLRDAGYKLQLFTDVSPEPDLELAEKLLNITRTSDSDLVIGIGGGSALDLAKIAAVLADHEGAAADYLNLTGTRRIERRGLPKVLIPTTSGTGSEVTDIAVLSLGTTKDVVTHPFLLADAAIVDPELTITVPPRVTAATGMDALTHAIEAYLSVNAGPVSDGLALHAVRLAGRSLAAAVRDGSRIAAREDMSGASFMAGLAFYQAGVAGVHAMAYPLGGLFHLPHGEANAVLLPYVMDHIRVHCAERMADLEAALSGKGQGTDAEESSKRFVRRLRTMIGEAGLPSSLAEYGIPETALSDLTADALKQTRLLARSPVRLTVDDILKIYRNAWTGTLNTV